MKSDWSDPSCTWVDTFVATAETRLAARKSVTILHRAEDGTQAETRVELGAPGEMVTVPGVLWKSLIGVRVDKAAPGSFGYIVSTPIVFDASVTPELGKHGRRSTSRERRSRWRRLWQLAERGKL